MSVTPSWAGRWARRCPVLLWLGSAALDTRREPRAAIILLVVGGVCICPLTRLGLWLVGGRGKIRPDNPRAELGWQVAFVLPLCLPLIAAAATNVTLLYFAALGWFLVRAEPQAGPGDPRRGAA
jgi:hypothetical protein